MSQSPRISRHFSAGRIVLFILVVIAWTAFIGNQRVPTGPAAGNSLHGDAPASQPSGVLRVAQYNIAGGVGGQDNRLDLDRTAAALKGFDLCGLEEIHGGGITRGPDEAQILGEKLNLPWLFAPVETRWWHDDFGNGIITSLPVNHWQRIPISSGIAKSNRNMLIVSATFDQKPLNILITHLGRDDDRPAQLSIVLATFNDMREPAIIIADLNSVPDDPQIVALRKTDGITDPIGDALKPNLGGNIDWIFARGMTTVHSGISNNGASDHYMAWAELRGN